VQGWLQKAVRAHAAVERAPMTVGSAATG
jgi:hypothetical protein